MPRVHRIWVIQEVFFFQHVPYLLYNGHRRNLLHILWVAAFVSRIITVSGRGIRSGTTPSHLRITQHARLLQLAVVKSEWTLESLIWLTADYQASDPRDKFFALLSLAGDFRLCPTPRGLQANYAKPLEQVARDAHTLSHRDFSEPPGPLAYQSGI
jgi:hypothetical protein